MSGLSLRIPELFEVRIADVTEDAGRRNRHQVHLEVRLMITDPPGEWRKVEPLQVGNVLKMSLTHQSNGS
jgi:hypothetical protein